MSTIHWRRGGPSAGTRHRITAVAAVAVLGLTAACTSGSSDGTSTGDPGKPKAGGTLRFAVAADPITLNPRGKTSGRDALSIIRQMFDSLVEQDPQTGKIEPWLAKSWQVNANATQFTFHLRDDVTFSDGSALTAQVVKQNLDDIVTNEAQESPQILTNYISYKGSTVVDPHTVTVTFKTPNAPFLSVLTSTQFAMISPKTLAQRFENRGNALSGTGPFVLKSYAKNSEVVLTRRAGYKWAPSDRAHDGDAYLDGIRFQIIPEPSVRTGSLQTGQVDGISGVLPENVSTLKRSATVLAKAIPGTVFGLTPLVNIAPLNDPAVRKAIALGINDQEIVDTVLGEEFKPATSAVTSTTPGYVDLHDKIVYDPDKAKSALDAAGWTAEGGGTRTKNGAKLTLKVGWFAQFSDSQQSLELLKSQLQKIGVDLELVQRTPAEIVTGLANSDFNLFWYDISGADGDVLRSVYTDAAPNYLHHANDQLQPLLQQQAGIQDTAKRNAVLAQIQKYIIDNALVYPVFEETSLLAVSKSVHDVRFDAGAALGQLYSAWLS